MVSELRQEIVTAYGDAPSVGLLTRLIACDSTLGSLLVGAEAEEEGAIALRRAYALLCSQDAVASLRMSSTPRESINNTTAAGAVSDMPPLLSPSMIETLVPTPLEDILRRETTPAAEDDFETGDPLSQEKEEEEEKMWTVRRMASVGGVVSPPSFPYWAVSLSMHILNGLALYVTKTDSPLPTLRAGGRSTEGGEGADPVEISIALLQRSESLYQAWDALVTTTTPSAMHVIQLPISEAGDLLLESIPYERHPAYWERFQMEDTRITTLFYLAQALTSKGEMIQAFRYCHITLYLQLVLHKETSKMEWARNTLQLSSHYCNFGAFAQAFHCLQAADALMPKDSPDEENVGVLYWSYGRYYKHRLQHFAEERRSQSRREEELDFSKGWLDFPIEGVPRCESVAPLVTYDDAREEFKKGMKWINAALEYYPFELLCTSHIELQQDICRLYDALSAFETDPSREIAFVQRQIGVLDPYPSQLNFNAYPTLIRQLLYDLGCLREHLIELRVGQRQRHARAVASTGVGALTPSMTEEKPISDAQLNKLVLKAAKNFHDFCQSWMTDREAEERRAKNLPAPSIGNIVIEEGSRVAFFRAMMRIARLHTMMAYPTPKEEYEGIKRACQDYEKAVAFAERNPFPAGAPASLSEVEYAKELINLLRVKQSDLYGAFAR